MTGGSAVFVIAEAGVNHNGSTARALDMIDAAAAAGADAVKFQTFVPEQLVSRHAAMAGYQKQNTGRTETQLEMIRALRLDEAAHRELKARCIARGVEFMSSPFDFESLKFLVSELGVNRVKLGSGEITNGPLLVACARSGLPVILSTGMATLADVRLALSALAWGYLHESAPSGLAKEFESAYAEAEEQGVLRRNVTLLHCTSQYPTPVDAANLRALATLRDEFGIPVGFSDHTLSVVLAAAAVALGAQVVEKHFTLDRALAGPDHAASLEPAELKELIDNVRTTQQALGDGLKIVQDVERENLEVARKSVVADIDIARGDVFSVRNLSIKRPGGGLEPFRYWSLLGKTATRDYRADEMIDPES